MKILISILAAVSLWECNKMERRQNGKMERWKDGKTERQQLPFSRFAL